MLFDTLQEIDLDWLKANHCRIYYFGLGFIQVVVNPRHRLHFYTPELPPITEDIHNHRYDFISKILKGNLTNKIYCVWDAPEYTRVKRNHVLVNESCNPDNKAPDSKVEVEVSNFEYPWIDEYREGQSYLMRHDQFHRVETTDCISSLVRGHYKKEFAQVVYEKGKNPVCPFSQKIPEPELWQIIERML